MRKKEFISILPSIMIALTILSCNPKVEKSPAEELIEVINNVVERKEIMLGHQDATVYGHNWSYEPNRSDVLEVVGDYPAVMGWDIGDIEFGHEKNLDGVPFDLMRSEIIKQHERGGINTISWHAYNPCGGTAWDEGAGMVTSILKGGENFDMYQERLAKVADFLTSLKDKEGKLIPVIFRPWHEHNGNWFWWGEKWCTHAEYRELWNMTYKYMTARNLNNLVWCYMPVGGAMDKDPDLSQFDMVGFDEYPYNGKMDIYKENFKAKMEVLKIYHTKHNKIMAVSETGHESLPVEGWFSDVVMPLIKDEPISYVLFWRNAWDKPEHFYCSYKGHSSEADFTKFVNSPKIITLKEIK